MPGYTQGSWTVIEIPYKSNKALLRCECGHEGWYFISNLSSNNSTRCWDCRTLSGEQKTFSSVKLTARRRKIEWPIAFNDWLDLVKQNCFYCESSPSNYISAYGFYYNGLDRIDSSRSYEISNVVPCCQICNRAKSDRSQDEFYEWIRKVYSYASVREP